MALREGGSLKRASGQLRWQEGQENAPCTRPHVWIESLWPNQWSYWITGHCCVQRYCCTDNENSLELVVGWVGSGLEGERWREAGAIPEVWVSERESVGSLSTNDKFCSPFLSFSNVQVKIMRAEDGFWGEIIWMLKNVALAAGTSLGCSARLSEWTQDDTGNFNTITVKGKAWRCSSSQTGLVIAFINFDRHGFVYYPFHLSLSLPLSGSLPVSLSYNSIVARSAHCRIPLIGERTKGKNGIKVRWHAAAIRCAVKSRGKKVWPCSADGRKKQLGTFFRSGRVVPLWLCAFMWGSGRLGCETRPIICLDSLGWEQANWGGRDEQTPLSRPDLFPQTI